MDFYVSRLNSKIKQSNLIIYILGLQKISNYYPMLYHRYNMFQVKNYVVELASEATPLGLDILLF